MIRKIGFVLLFSLPLMAAVTGTVVNRTTGQPQAAATVTLYKFGQGGMEAVTSAKTDAQGNFSIDRDAGGQGPSMVRVEIDNVTYNHMMPPGTPTTGITVDVYNASRQPGPAKVGKHMILLQPDGNGQMTVAETFLLENPGKTTWANPVDGTLHFYLPDAAKGQVEVTASAPDGMPVPVPTSKSSKPEVFLAKFECKPGETRFDLHYTVPYIAGDPFSGKVVSGDDNTYLVAPNGVTLEGDSTKLQDLGVEPRSQTHIFGLSATAYKVKLTGAAAAAPAQGDAAASDQPDSGSPPIEVIMPRVYSQKYLIVGIALGILALGFALLYRTPTPKENNERSRG